MKEIKIVGAKNETQASSMKALAEFCGLDEIRLSDTCIREILAFHKNGKVFEVIADTRRNCGVFDIAPGAYTYVRTEREILDHMLEIITNMEKIKDESKNSNVT